MGKTAIFNHSEVFILESGQTISNLTLAYQTFGTLNSQKNNVIWVCHALTANAEVNDWWSGLFGEGKILDPTRYFIVCANNLGSCYGSTNAFSINKATNLPYFHEFPLITIKDMANSLELLKNHLQISTIKTLIGGSMGGQIAMEWAILNPEVTKNLILLATNAFHSAWGIAFNETQRMAIATDPTWAQNTENAGKIGLKTARAIALLSYRNYFTYQTAQKETDNTKVDAFKSASYQQYQGEKLVKRFNAYAYWTLSKAMDSHNVGRGYKNVQIALKKIKAKTLIIGISSDVLFPLEEQLVLQQYIPDAFFVEIQSLYGHDGFLIEYQQITTTIQEYFTKKAQVLEENSFI